MSCGDNPLSEDEEPPQIPDFQNIQHNISYFEERSPQSDSSYYAKAHNHVKGFRLISLITEGYIQYLSDLNYSDYKYQNEEWSWTYTIMEDDTEIEATLTATQRMESITWELFFSIKNEFENLKVLEGETSLNENSGYWTFNEQKEGNEETPLFTSSWEDQASDNIQIETEFYNFEGTIQILTNYHQDNSTYMVLIEFTENQDKRIIYWDIEAETGYYQIGSDSGERYCWDSNFEDIDCDDVGY